MMTVPLRVIGISIDFVILAWGLFVMDRILVETEP